MTGVHIAVGSALIAWYLRTAGASSVVGVVSAPLAVLLWIYYEAQILLAGAQLAKNLTAVTTNEDMEIKTGPDDLAWSPGGESVAVIARGTLSTEPEVRATPADRLLADFYNLYEIPVGGPQNTPR